MPIRKATVHIAVSLKDDTLQIVVRDVARDTADRREAFDVTEQKTLPERIPRPEGKGGHPPISKQRNSRFAIADKSRTSHR